LEEYWYRFRRTFFGPSNVSLLSVLWSLKSVEVRQFIIINNMDRNIKCT
jgi:hypothetical protein